VTSGRLRVGIIGLGRCWRRYRPALLRLGGRFAVRAVCDPVARRAEVEAKGLGCAAAAGPGDLVERADVDAVLLFGRQWFGLWPVERACAAGKPVFCAAPAADEEAHADALAGQVRERGLPVLMAHPYTCSPALGRLEALVGERLGQVRLVRAEQALPAKVGADLLRAPALLPLLARCATLLGTAVRSVRVVAGEAGLCALVLEGDGRAAQVSLWAGRAVGAACRVEVVAEKGTAVAELPRQVRWRDAEGQHAQRLPCRPAEEVLLERFADALRDGQAPRPGVEEVRETLALLRAAWRSREEDRCVSCLCPG
jgi:predicted dehydrogenase